MNTFPLAELSSHTISLYRCNLDKSINRYNETQKGRIVMIKLRADDKPFNVRIRGEMCTQGINDTEFQVRDSDEKYTSYTIGMELEDEDLDAINDLIETVTNLVKEIGLEFEVNDPIKDCSKLYIKCKTDRMNKRFNFACNLPITPKKYGETMNAQFIDFQGALVLYFNLEERECGLTFVTKSLDFDQAFLAKAVSAPTKTKLSSNHYDNETPVAKKPKQVV